MIANVSLGSIIDPDTFGNPVVNALNPTEWTMPTLQNGWNAVVGLQDPEYRRIGDVVYLRGSIQNGTVGVAAFTLPAGFRPPAQDVMSVGAASGVIARITVLSNGQVQVLVDPGDTDEINLSSQFSVSA